MLRNNWWAGLLVFMAAVGGGAVADPAEPKTNRDDVLRAYYSANGLLNRELYELAATEYRAFLSGHGDHAKVPEARYGLAVCLYRLRQYGDAIAELVQLRSATEIPYGAEVTTILGQCYLARKQYAAAAEVFVEVVREYAGHDLADDAAAGATEAFYLDGKYDKAIAQCRLLGSRWPTRPRRARGEFFGGLAAMGQGDYAGAAERFSTVLDEFPKEPLADQASLLLAQCYHHEGLLERAGRQYRQVLEKTGTRLVSEALYGLGLLALGQGQPREAGDFFDRLVKEYPDSAQVFAARFQRGRAWFEQGEVDRAFALFEQSISEPQDKALAGEATYWAAKCVLRQGRFADAAERLGKAIEKFPTSELLPEMHYDRAIALVRSGERQAGMDALTEFRRQFPDHEMAADALHLLATTAHELGGYDQSQGHCRTFLEAYPGHELTPAVAFLFCENGFLSGEYGPAAESYLRFLESFPDDPQVTRAKYRLGTALYRLERFQEAEPLLTEVGRLAKTEELFRFSLLALGDICFQRSEWKQAERYLSDYLSPGADLPSADDALLKLGLSLQRQDKHAEALRAYDRLLTKFDQSPHKLQAVFERGQVLVALGRNDEAVRAFERVLKEGGASRFQAYALNHLGALAMQRKDFGAAAQLFERVAGDEAGAIDEAAALFRRGQAFLADGQFAEAEVVFAEYLDRYSSQAHAPEAGAQLAIALARQDRYREALEVIGRVEGEFAGRLEPSLHRSMCYEKAWCQRQAGQTREAAKTYRELLTREAQDDVHTHALLELAAIEMEGERYASAAELLRQLRRNPTEAASVVPHDVDEQQTYQLAVCEFELGHATEAAELFGEFITRFPESPLVASASFFCGEALYELGKHGPAVVHLTRVVENFPSDPVYPPSLLRLGECLAALQRWPRSEQVFAEYLDRFGDSDQWFQARFGLGWARENQGRYDGAIRAYEKVVAGYQGPTAARAQFQIGECLFAKKDYANAARELLKVDILYAYPEWSAAALYEAGQCFEKLSKSVEARAQFKAVTERFPETRWAQMAAKRLANVVGGSLPGR